MSAVWARVNQNSLAQIMKRRRRYIHVSAALVVRQNERTGLIDILVQRPGVTLNLGRNASKRALRARRFA